MGAGTWRPPTFLHGLPINSPLDLSIRLKFSNTLHALWNDGDEAMHACATVFRGIEQLCKGTKGER